MTVVQISLCVLCVLWAILRKTLSSSGDKLDTLDKFDVAILRELQADARLTNAELAQRVGLSAAPCWRRVRALEEAGIPIDMVGGTSMGAAMAGLIAFDRPSATLIDVARRTFSRNPTGDFTLAPLISLIGGRRLRRAIDDTVRELSGFDAHVEDTWKPYYCVATNYSRASEEVLRRGPLAKSIRASVSIPAALPPVIFDGELMMDGGTVNNFPTDVMARQGAGFIFGCDLMRDTVLKVRDTEVPSGWALLRDRLRPKRQRRHRLPSLISIILNISILHSQSRLHASRQLTDICVTPRVGRIGMLDWKAFDVAMEAGYRSATEAIARMPAEQLARLRDDGDRRTIAVPPAPTF